VNYERFLVSAFLAAAVAVAAAGAPQVQGTPVGETTAAPSGPPPLPGGPAPDLTIAFTSYVVGYVEPCG
jgi:hypothetical protein